MTKIAVDIKEPTEEFLENVHKIGAAIADTLYKQDCNVNEAHAALMIHILRAIEGSEEPINAWARTKLSLDVWGKEEFGVEHDHEIYNVPEDMTLQ